MADERQVVVSHYEVFRTLRLHTPDGSVKQTTAKLSVGISLSFYKKDASFSAEANSDEGLITVPVAKCYLDLTIAVDWTYQHDSQHTSNDKDSLEDELIKAFSSKVYGFYYTGLASSVLGSDVDLSTTKSVQNIESQLVGTEAHLSISINPLISGSDLVIKSASWHLYNNHHGITLQTTSYCHNNKHFPLFMFTSPQSGTSKANYMFSLPTYFHVITNIDRNVLFPRFALLDSIYTSALTRLAKLFSTAQSVGCPIDWAPLTLSNTIDNKRKRTSRNDLLNQSCSVIQAFYTKLLKKGVDPRVTLVPELSFASDLLIFYNREQLDDSQIAPVDMVHVDIAAILTDSSPEAKTRIASLSRLTVMSSFPSSEQLRAAGFDSAQDSTLSRDSSSAHQNETRLAVQKAEQKFSRLFDDMAKLAAMYHQITKGGEIACVYNPYAQATVLPLLKQQPRLSSSSIIAQAFPSLTPNNLNTQETTEKQVEPSPQAKTVPPTSTTSLPLISKEKSANVIKSGDDALSGINQNVLAKCVADIVFEVLQKKHMLQQKSNM